MSKTIEEHVNAFVAARKAGILGVYPEWTDLRVQVAEELLLELANGNYSFESNEDSEFPYEVSATINGIKYFLICDEHDFKNKFGGNLSERTSAHEDYEQEQ